MELPSSSVISNGFQKNTISCLAFPLFTTTTTTTSTITTKRDKRRSLQLAIATHLHKQQQQLEVGFQQVILSPPTSSRKPYLSNSYFARQSALLQMQQSSHFLSDIQRLGGTLKVHDLNVLLRHFGNLNKWQELSQLFEWMQKHKKFNASSYSSYIKLLGMSLNCTKALEVYNYVEDDFLKTNISVCNSVLNCLVKNGKFDSCLKLYYQMKQDGLRPDAVTYSTLLAGCIKIKQGYSKALELVREMQDTGIHMDSVIFGTLIAVCASNKQWKEAEKYFKLMTDAGHPPNIYHYSSLLNAYSMDGDCKKADELFQDMKLAGLVPNKVILTTLLKVYVRGGLFEKSSDLLRELEALGYAKDEMPYCLLMDGLAKAGCIDEAKSVFNSMKEKDVQSDGYSHSIMISAFCRAGLIDEAKQLAEEYEAEHDKYDLVLMNTMICAYCRAGEMESVMLMLKKMDSLLLAPDYHTYHILIKYFLKEQVYMLAYQTMRDMYSKGHEAEEELTSSLIFHLGKTRAYSEAFSVYKMLRAGRTICKDLHEKVLRILIAGRLLNEAYEIVKANAKLITRPTMKKFAKAYIKMGNIKLINDVIMAIHGSGYKIDQDLYEIAILRYIDRPEEKELFFQLLQWMPGQGYVVDPSTRNLILKNSNLFGRELVAKKLSEQHKVSKSLISQNNLHINVSQINQNIENL